MGRGQWLDADQNRGPRGVFWERTPETARDRTQVAQIEFTENSSHDPGAGFCQV